MSNKYLAKAAGASPPSSLTAKIGLGVSTVGLGIGVANYHNNKQSRVLENQRIRLERERVKLQEEQHKLDQKSLSALRSINNKLAAK